MNLTQLFTELWHRYAAINPQAQAIHDLLQQRGDRIVNDHLAFRTFRHPRLGLDQLAHPFENLGYRAVGTYHFKAKKLLARHYEAPDAPKIFISELILDQCSETLRQIVHQMIDAIPPTVRVDQDFLLRGRPWPPVSRAVWQQLRDESEYAAWMAAFGYCANHFTILVNALTTIPDLEALCALLRERGFTLNESGGLIKGGPAVHLAQASTRAPDVQIDFVDGTAAIPGCYYEFAQRYPLPDGTLFQGFVADSADRIFESTDAGPR